MTHWKRDVPCPDVRPGDEETEIQSLYDLNILKLNCSTCSNAFLYEAKAEGEPRRIQKVDGK
jgi:hypothetical protein